MKFTEFLKYATYPLLTGSAVVFGLWAVGHSWPPWAVGVSAIAVAMVLAEILEYVIPYSEIWRVARQDRLTDFYHLLFSNRAFDLGTLVAIGLVSPIGQISIWPHHWPLLVQTVLAILLYELPWYWVHRLEHAWPLLWRVHSVHHSSKRIYWWNVSRNHPIDNFISALAAFSVMILLGVGDAPLAVMAAFSAVHSTLQHSNIDLRTGFLDYFLATSRVHRWHHSPIRKECDANFSPRFMLWDHVFGTFRFQADVAPPENVGLGEGYSNYPSSYIAQFLIPFRSNYWQDRS